MQNRNVIFTTLLLGLAFFALYSSRNAFGVVPGPDAGYPSGNTGIDANGRENISSVAGSAIRNDQTLTFADRVAYQRAIEGVYWQHRIWPEANAGPKPPLDRVMSQAEIEKKVEGYLRNSQALENYWQRPITPDQLQAEMERMATHTKQPGVLREIFVALGNDPLVIAECLARPVLVERLLTELYAQDQRFHGELKRRAQAELRTLPSAGQMKQTSSLYTELEWTKSDSAEIDSAPEYETLPAAKVSPLREDEGHYSAVAVMETSKNRLKMATIAWLKEPLRSWVARAETQVPVTMAAVSANDRLPLISSPSGGCIDDTWALSTLTNAPDARASHTAVWTGSEMIVWGGYFFDGNDHHLNTGGRYNPSTDSWTATSTTNAPDPRDNHTAVWTGTEMILWGGYNGGSLNTGGRYNPSTDSWTPTSLTNAPDTRLQHTAVWTGSEMIVWGGSFFDGAFHELNTGGRYNPGTDSWTATSLTNAPDARRNHTAVWTGSEMIEWGGVGNSGYLNTGGRYNPGSDSWTPTSTANAPTGRLWHTAVWTGSEMIVWGGGANGYFNTGGRYDPGSDSWTPTSTANAPTARLLHTAVWTGSEMIVWGGAGGGYLNTGGRYNPSTNSWTPTSTTNAPDGREIHTAVWTGSQMIVWGGFFNDGVDDHYLNTGGRYCAAGPGPTPTPRPLPTPRPRPTPAPRP